jgi:hypothetical protein
MTTPPMLPVNCVIAAELMYEFPTMVIVLATIVIAVAVELLPPVKVRAADGKYISPFIN